MAEEERDLEELRKKRVSQLQQDQINQQQREEQQQQIENQRQMVLKGILTDEARERLGRIKLAKPDYANNLENQLIQLASSRRLSGKIDDEQLKQLLQQMTKSKRESKITFKRR